MSITEFYRPLVIVYHTFHYIYYPPYGENPPLASPVSEDDPDTRNAEMLSRFRPAGGQAKLQMPCELRLAALRVKGTADTIVLEFNALIIKYEETDIVFIHMSFLTYAREYDCICIYVY